MHSYIHMHYTHANTHTPIHMQIHMQSYTCKYTYTYTHANTRALIYMQIHVHTKKCTHAKNAYLYNLSKKILRVNWIYMAVSALFNLEYTLSRGFYSVGTESLIWSKVRDVWIQVPVSIKKNSEWRWSQESQEVYYRTKVHTQGVSQASAENSMAGFLDGLSWGSFLRGLVIQLRQKEGREVQEWIKVFPKQCSLSSFVPLVVFLAVLVSDAWEGKVFEGDIWTCHCNEERLSQQWSGLAVLVLPHLEWFHSLTVWMVAWYSAITQLWDFISLNAGNALLSSKYSTYPIPSFNLWGSQTPDW